MKKTLTALACLTLATPAIAADTIKIGLGVPMTGDYAPYSEWQGARCMAKKINAGGGVNGGGGIEKSLLFSRAADPKGA